jgi:hypothetical protein
MEDEYVPPSRLKLAVMVTVTMVAVTVLLACAEYVDEDFSKRHDGHPTFLLSLWISSVSVALFIILAVVFFFCTIPILFGIAYVYCGPTACVAMVLQCYLMRPDHRRLPE